MTLVIAKALKDIAWLVADTLITSPGGDLRQREYALKIFKLNPETLAAYSGAPEIAHRVLCAAAQIAKEPTIGELVHLIISNTQDSSIDFILAHSGRLHVIKDGAYQANAAFAYLGNQEASEAFAANYEMPMPSDSTLAEIARADLQIVQTDSIAAATTEATRIGFRLYDAMNAVSADSTHWTVGGPTVLACSARSHASYALFSCHNTPAFLPVKEQGWHSIGFGDASSGGHSFSIITELGDTAVSAWGVFHKQGYFGRLFIADLNTGTFQKIEGTADSAAAFCSAVALQYGINITHAGSI
jgi:hypothetical protein